MQGLVFHFGDLCVRVNDLPLLKPWLSIGKVVRVSEGPDIEDYWTLNPPIKGLIIQKVYIEPDHNLWSFLWCLVY